MKIEKICQQCGKEFSVLSCLAKRKFCGESCRIVALRELNAARNRTPKMRERSRQNIAKYNSNQPLEHRQRASQWLTYLNKTRTYSADERSGMSARMKVRAKEIAKQPLSDKQKTSRHNNMLKVNRLPRTKKQIQSALDKLKKAQRISWTKERREIASRSMKKTMARPEMKVFARNHAITVNKSAYSKPTAIENKIMCLLLSWHIKFIPQKVFANIGIIDFFCPNQSLCIETDGDYWHSRDGVPEKDARKDAALNKLGLRVLRLKEKEINKQFDAVMQKVSTALLGLESFKDAAAW